MTSWPRPHFEAGGGDPFLFYVMYGEFPQTLSPSRQQYRTNGLPEGLAAMKYDDASHPEVRSGFLEGYLWDLLREEDASLAEVVQRAPACFILKGAPTRAETLDYLRDVVGLLTYLFDHGGVGLYDPFMFKWWSSEEWRRRIFEADEPVAHRHVTVLASEDEGPDRQWLHTRGMQKFGRPDLSIRAVPGNYRSAVLDLVNRLINLQAYGGVISDGQLIRSESLPDDMSCHHGGSPDDPDFNNVHVEIRWP